MCYAWNQEIYICLSVNATHDMTHKTLHNIPERHVFGQDTFYGKFHHSTLAHAQ